LTLEQMHARPTEALRRVYEFIGVDPERGLELAGTRHNTNATRVDRRFARLGLIRPFVSSYLRATDGVAGRLGRTREQQVRIKRYLQLPFRRSTSRTAMSPDMRRLLAEIYAPHIERLGRILSRSFPEWESARKSMVAAVSTGGGAD
jgi:hypothetical protein